MRTHIKNIHLKQRNYECSYCGKAYATKTGMKIHEAAVHGDVKYARFECNICHKRWYEKGSYFKHKKLAHRPKDPIKEMIKRGECIYSDCDKKYNRKHPEESVRRHLVSTHKDRRYAKYECKKCKKLFYDKKSYTKHMKHRH